VGDPWLYILVTVRSILHSISHWHVLYHLVNSAVMYTYSAQQSTPSAGTPSESPASTNFRDLLDLQKQIQKKRMEFCSTFKTAVR
jgi:hypothetical protein